MKTRFFHMYPFGTGLKERLAGLITLTMIVMVVASCGDFKKTSVVAPPSTGKLDFSRYVALGNSLTAGFQSGALFQSAQTWSYPADIARQAGVPDSNFQQPLITDPGIGGRMKLLSLNGPVIGADPSSGLPINIGLARPYNNLGVPGAVLADMLYTTDFAAQANPNGRNNPFFEIVLRSNALGSNMVEQALALHPTFMSVWIGANDVLGYATNGGTLVPITDPTTFGAIYVQTMDSLLTGAPTAKFVVANIPDVTAIPYFTTVPPVVVNPATKQPVIVNGQPVPLIVARHDASGNLYFGQANPRTDFILLTALDSMEVGVGIPVQLGGTGRPLPDQFVLDSLEVTKVEAAIQAYNNNTIATFATLNSSRVALVDAYSAFNNFAKYGYVAQGIVLTNSYISGGFFGLDGVHPTSQGYAYVANIFIQAINSHFGSNIPLVPISSVPGSIVLEQIPTAKVGLPKVHYSDLKPMLQLIQKRNF